MEKIVPQCEEINCLLDGKCLSGDIEEFNVPNLEILTINANAPIPRLDIELKMPGAERELASVNPNTPLKIRGSIRNNYGETVQAIWKFCGLPTNIPIPHIITTLKLTADAYKHVIDGEEKYYIDALNMICRINGKDYRACDRELLGIETVPDRL